MSDVEVIARGLCVVDGAVLLCQTAGAAVTYLPGGHIEFQERARASLQRELREECGLASTAGRFLGVVEHAFVQKGKPKAEINLVFALTVPGIGPRQVVPSQEAHIEFRWVRLGALAAARLEPAPLCTLIPRWARGEFEVTWASTYGEG